MRAAIHTYGTRGDIQPYVALAIALRSAGHEIQLAGPVQYSELAEKHGLSYHSLPGDLLALIDTPEGKAALNKSEGFAAGFKLLRHVRPMMETLLTAEWEATRDFGPDVIIYHPKALAAPHIAERLGCRAVLASPLPILTPTSAFPSPIVPVSSLGPFNRLSHQTVVWGSQRLFAKSISKWRGQCLKLPPRPDHRLAPLATLYAYSRHVLPAPADWASNVHVTGPWFLEQPAWPIPARLKDFTESGEQPVYVSFGSMPGIEPEKLTSKIVKALRLTGRRGLIATGAGALSVWPEEPGIFFIDEAPHDRILPLVRSALHHGGAGTTMATARAGIPCTICPFLGDQPFWGRRMYSLGISPRPLSRKGLTPEILAEAIDAMDSPTMRSQAAALGEKVRREDGLRSAVDLLERYCL